MIAWLKAASQTALAQQFGLSWDEVHGIMDRAVERGLDGFGQTLTAEQLTGIEGVAIDMWDPFEKSIRAHLPDAAGKIVYEGHEVRLAAERGELRPRVVAGVPGIEGDEPEDVARLGDQGAGDVAVGLRRGDVGAEAVPSLVLRGDA